MFSTLIEPAGARRRRGVALVGGLLCNVLMIVTGILVGMLFPQELPIAHHRFLAWVPFLTPREKPVVRRPREVARVIIPKLTPPEVPKLVAPRLADPAIPKTRPTIAALPAPPVPASAPPMSLPNPPSKKVEITIQKGLFGGAPKPVTTKRPAEQVQTGGFGSPQGLPGHAHGDNPGNIPVLGSFGLPDGPGKGNGTGGAQGIPGVVASAGFGNRMAGGGDGHNGGGQGEPSVNLGGFTKAEPVAPAPTQAHHEAPAENFQPAEIISKPAPVYTEEARRLGIQGEVTLSVVFQASGTLRIIAVVKSLGHGLDQAAEQAAAQIRFKPAMRSGQPADFPANLRIQFRLADQHT